MADHTKIPSENTAFKNKKMAGRLSPGKPVTESLQISLVGPEEVLETKPLANDLQKLLSNLGHDVKMMVAAKLRGSQILVKELLRTLHKMLIWSLF